MTAKQTAAAYAAAALALLVLDAFWLTTMASRLYRPALGDLMRETPDFLAAGLFYALYLAGVVIFAVRPSVDARSWTAAAARGAAFGLVAYATYDLTNQATLRGWPWHVTLVDLAWGTFLTATGAVAGRAGARALGRR